VTGTTIRPIEVEVPEGFVEIEGEGFYVIPDVDRMAPFLMSIVSDSDHWMFVSSRGALTAGRGSAASALFPYETDDRLHRAVGTTGPVTAIRVHGDDGVRLWRPFRDGMRGTVHRNLYKSVVGNQVVFEEINVEQSLVFRYRWANSERFGFVRTVSIVNAGDRAVRLELIDGLVNVLPHGLSPALYAQMSNLTNAYKRSQRIDGGPAVFTLEAMVVDRPEPAESLRATIVWSTGFDGTVTLDPDAVAAFEAGEGTPGVGLVTGQPGAYLLTGNLDVAAGETVSWHILADVAQDQVDVTGLQQYLRSAQDPVEAITASVAEGTAALVRIMGRSDGLQRTGDRVATAHQFANVTYNVMRGGIPMAGYTIDLADFVAFVESRNRHVANRHRPWFEAQPATITRTALVEAIAATDDPQFIRLGLEYLPFGFSRRHGDPSRPWNAFSIRVRDEAGRPSLYYEGNWRDIFQNWEALCLSFPEYLPGVVSVFVNASTADGFNPYRITRHGIDWEEPDPEDPWSNIGYWGDHQIVYLLRLLEATRRFLPGEIERLLSAPWFSYADVPYRIAPYDELVRNPKATIDYDAGAAKRSAARVDELGGDGRLLWARDRHVYLVTLMEKLLVPALAKLSNYVPGGGIWMNTQRPEWNDANNALVGYGVSMVTLYQVRRYLDRLRSIIADSGLDEVWLSTEVSDWLVAVTAVMRGNLGVVGPGADDRQRKNMMDELGWAFSDYRSRVYDSGFSGTTTVDLGAITALCDVAIEHVDDTIRRNRRDDGLYHSYNLIHFTADGSGARVEHLFEMLEGQVNVLGAGVLSAAERADVVDALFDSAMYRPDQRSFMLYPARSLPSFLDKNLAAEKDVAANPLLAALVAAGDRSVIAVDADGRYRFSADLSNRGDLAAVLDRLAADDRWADLVAGHRAGVYDAYERVFHHHAFTGRSGSMYGYEGIGSIYWHMVAKLLVAVQESVLDAREAGADPATVARLIDGYWRVRAGLGFNKTAGEYGAFPTDPYSHTPGHAGAQQPGMTGQVKEELLTRPLEVGIRVDDGSVVFDPVLLRSTELLDEPEPWEVLDGDGPMRTIELEPGSLGATLCEVPMIVSAGSGEASIEIVGSDGSSNRRPGLRLDRAASAAIFARTGEIREVRAFIPESDVVPSG
jgi:hypothetical protein